MKTPLLSYLTAASGIGLTIDHENPYYLLIYGLITVFFKFWEAKRKAKENQKPKK